MKNMEGNWKRCGDFLKFQHFHIWMSGLGDCQKYHVILDVLVGKMMVETEETPKIPLCPYFSVVRTAGIKLFVRFGEYHIGWIMF